MSGAGRITAGMICCLIFLAVNAAADMKNRTIWWPGCLAGAAAGILCHFLEGSLDLGMLAISLLPGAAMAAVSWLCRQQLGMGDALVVMTCAVMTDLWTVLGMLMAGFWCAGAYALFLLLVRKKDRKESFPLVPFLLAGMLLTCFA